jgi:hypothetical protein
MVIFKSETTRCQSFFLGIKMMFHANIDGLTTNKMKHKRETTIELRIFIFFFLSKIIEFGANLRNNIERNYDKHEQTGKNVYLD